jgi:hypothetical protein
MLICEKICLVGSLEGAHSLKINYIKAFSRQAWAIKYLKACGVLGVYAFVEGEKCTPWKMGNEVDLAGDWT